MVNVSYLIDNPGAPSGLKSFVNHRVVPPAIDAAGAFESIAYELGEQARAKPAATLLAAGALGLLAGVVVFSLLSRR